MGKKGYEMKFLIEASVKADYNNTQHIEKNLSGTYGSSYHGDFETDCVDYFRSDRSVSFYAYSDTMNEDGILEAIFENEPSFFMIENINISEIEGA